MESTAQVWVCDQCKHVWLMGEIVPTHCAKCRSRRWNNGSGKPRDTRVNSEEHATSQPEHDSGSGRHDGPAKAIGVPVSVQSLRDICDGKGIEAKPVSSPESTINLCIYRDLPNEAGDILGCGKPMGHKGIHGNYRKVGDVWG